MNSKIDICNMALAHIGAPKISSLTGALTKESSACNLFWDNTRRSVLRIHLWNFAIKEIILAETIDDYLGYEYSYVYPVDCLYIHKIYSSDKFERPVYEVRLSNDNSKKIILTDIKEAKILYIADIDNAVLFDGLFIEALSWLLASNLCQTIRGDVKLQNNCFNIYTRLINNAMARDSNEIEYEKNDSCDFFFFWL